MKRVLIRTETREANGAITTTHREEESHDSGLLEAWAFLALLLSTLLVTYATYRAVSGMVASRTHNLTEYSQLWLSSRINSLSLVPSCARKEEA